MKVKKECIEYIRRFKDDEAKRHQESSTTFSFVSLFLFSIYLSFSLLLLSQYMIRLCHLVSCIQTAATAGFRPFTTILSRSSFCTLHPIYTIQRLFFFTLPSSSLVSFFKKKLILTDCFFSVGLFVCVCFFVSTAAAAAAPTAFLFRLQSVWMYVCMYVCAYV